MKKYTVLLLFVSLFFLEACSSLEKEKIIQKWPNGQIRYKIIYQSPEDTTSYSFIQYYENGEIYSKGAYLKDQKNGTIKSWYKGGKLCSEEIFTSDELKSFTYLYEDGSLKSKGVVAFYDTVLQYDSVSKSRFYVIGDRGNYKSWYQGGRLESEMCIIDSNTALFVEWDSLGVLIRRDTLRGTGNPVEMAGVKKNKR